MNDWYKKRFRRILVDMHIADWDSSFLKKLNPESYVKLIKKGGATSHMVYCVSHVGLAFYPSKIGPAHKSLRNLDFTGRVMELSRKNKLSVVAYYSVIYNNAMFLKNPDWRIAPLEGKSAYKDLRYGVCCPNSPYKDFALAQTEEICRRYDFDGIFFDMVFWPHVCYCRHCRERFRKDTGKTELPRKIAWENPDWILFQRMRERWMDNFAAALTAVVKKTRPSMTVTHQMAPVLVNWNLGMPYSLMENCDYASGDFYGPAIQQSVVCKIFEAISIKKPFEFHTSRCVDLTDHVTNKSLGRLETQASLAPAHASAFMFIDAINPDGTMNPGVYDMTGEIFGKLARYEKYLGGELKAEVGIYVSSESRFSIEENGHPRAISIQKINPKSTHMDSVMGIAQSLQESHITFGVITKKNIKDISKFRIIVLPEVFLMSDEEISAFRKHVRDGGGLYVCGHSSLIDINGKKRKDFGLKDVLGISLKNKSHSGVVFALSKDKMISDVLASQSHLIHNGICQSVRATKAKVLATVSFPYYDEKKGTVLKTKSFASIHSNPPGKDTQDCFIAFNNYGKGKSCYTACAIETADHKINRKLVSRLTKKLLCNKTMVETDAPGFIEITFFDKKPDKKLNISFIAFREYEDRLPCSFKVKINFALMGKEFIALRSLPDYKNIKCEVHGKGVVEFAVNDLEILKMFEVEYETR